MGRHGGHRWSLLSRLQVQQLAQLALEHPKWTVKELHAFAMAQRLLPEPPPSETTVWRALRKAGLSRKRARFTDPRVATDEAVAAERRAFQQAQREDPELAAGRLLFFDESNFRLNEQQSWGWAVDGPARLPRTKGQTPTTTLLLTMGQLPGHRMILHASLRPPQRKAAALPARYTASELQEPGKGAPSLREWTKTALRKATNATLRELLKKHGVRSSGIRKQELVARALRLKTTGRLGLPRAGRAYQGGPVQPFRGTTQEVVKYFLEDFLPSVPEVELKGRRLVWDNASTHSPVGTGQTEVVSVFHRWFREWGLAGCAFLPPRSPSKNPVELCFAYLKRHVRKWAPAEGYTQAALEDAIRRAVAKVTPVMVRRWIRACGYRQAPEPARSRQRVRQQPEEKRREKLSCRSEAPLLPVRARLICADVNGTVVKEKRPGKTEWHWAIDPAKAQGDLQDIVPRRKRDVQEATEVQVRWAGYGPEPAGVRETAPEVGLLEPGVYEPERIVDERLQGGRREYRIRWKGYSATEDSWEPLSNLLVGRKALLEDWRRRR